jgi:lambda repressor-like predicted transcriptional regulator
VLIGEAEPFKPARARDGHRDEVVALREQGLSVREIAAKAAISKSTAQRILDDCPGVPDSLGAWDSGTPPKTATASRIRLSQAAGTVVGQRNGWHPHTPDEDAPDWWRS